MAESHRDEIAKLEALFATNPEGRAFAHLAEAYRKAGELQRAREVLEEGLRRHEDYASAYVVLGRVHREQGDADGAEEAFGHVLALDPHNLIALRGMGDLALQRGDTDTALEHYRELLVVEPGQDELEELIANLEGGGEAAADEPDAFEPAEAAAGVSSGDDSFDVAALATAEEGVPAAEDEGLLDIELTSFGREDETAEPESADEAGADDMDLSSLDLAEDETEPVGLAEAAFGLDEPEEEDLAEAALELDEPEEEELELPGAAAAAADERSWATQEADAGEFEAVASFDDDASEADPVVTETIADLYARQGLHERAAEVYRELLRTRPDDEALRRKLEEAESGEGSPAAAPSSTSPPSPEEEDLEALAEELGLLANESSEGEAAWRPGETETEEPAGPGSEAEDELADLLPSDQQAAAGAYDEEWYDLDDLPAYSAPEDVETPDLAEFGFGVDEEAAAVDEEPEEPLWAETFDDEPAPAEPGVAAVEQAAVEGPEEPEPVEERPEAERPLEEIEAAWTGGQGAEAGESSPYAWSEPGEESAAEGPELGGYFDALLSWRPGGGPAEAAAVAEVGEPAEDVVSLDELGAMEVPQTEGPDEFDLLFGGGAGTPEADAERAEPAEKADAGGEAVSGGAGADAAPAEGGEDDTDLDMFRAWLQSLKD